MTSLQPYPVYKDTNLPWLPKIPKHWEVQRAKFIFKKMARPVRKEDDVVTAFRDGMVTLRTNRRTEGFTFSIKEIGYQGIRQGDLVIHQMDGFAGAIGVSDSDGKSTPIYSVCVPLIPASTYFYAYLLRQMAKSDFILSLAKGIRERSSDFRFDVFKELELPIPPLGEQQAIAAYLDRQTAKIDALIAKKQRLLALLAERRAVFISRVVAKGLNSNVHTKDSEMNWIGKIPQHWKITKFKRIAEINYGIALELDRTETKGTYIISLPNVTKDGQLILEDVPMAKLSEGEKKKNLLRKGDLLFNWRNGSSDHVGKTAYFDTEGEYTHVSFLLRIRFNADQHYSRYYHMFLNNLRNTGFFSSSKSMVNNTYNQTELGNLKIMIPPRKEQEEIAEYLRVKLEKIDKLVPKIEIAIERLQEYRSALISSVVTGKVDVRNFS